MVFRVIAHIPGIEGGHVVDETGERPFAEHVPGETSEQTLIKIGHRTIGEALTVQRRLSEQEDDAHTTVYLTKQRASPDRLLDGHTIQIQT